MAAFNPSDKLEPGRSYQIVYNIGFMPIDLIKSAVEFAIRNAPDWGSHITIDNIEWNASTLAGRSNGVDLVVSFTTAANATGIAESGIDPKIVLEVIALIVVGILACTGTLKGMFVAVDDSVKAIGSAANAATTTISKMFDPTVLIGIAIVILVATPLLRKGFTK